MKFLIDKALSHLTAIHLRENGYTAYRVNELISGQKVDDDVIFDYAIEHDYVIITADVDFGKLLVFTQSKRSSVIIFRVTNQKVSNINRILIENIEQLTAYLEEGYLINIEDKRIKLIELPL
ncbi:MAG: DUF5615 family PIN-like protein [Candidatus Heimdallarchaeota archaeon]|nr:DUF5615 family PIN-like protein [Candidatus Heimdallarchaeota archaeon]